MQTTGLKYNRWTVISEPRKEQGFTVVDVRCLCGTLATKKLAAIKFGTPKSCGCQKREATADRNKAKGVKIPVGSVFGRLTTTGEPATHSGIRRVDCLCSCGRIKNVNADSLLAGHSKSCGCLRSSMVSEKNFKHGISSNPLYTVWGSMKDRCCNPTSKFYRLYGGRGITVCPEWLNDFESFYRDVGPSPFPGASLDRKDNDGNYCKENVRWATRAEQAANTSRNRLYTYKGREHMLKDIARLVKINLATLYYRIHRRGMTIDEAIAEPYRTTT